MSIRFRIGPFTFGSSGTRLSIWRRGSGFSMPLSGQSSDSFGKVKFGIFNFFFNSRNKRRNLKASDSDKMLLLKDKHNQAYEPWTSDNDRKLMRLHSEGKTIQELSEIFGRTSGAIRSRLDKLLFK